MTSNPDCIKETIGYIKLWTGIAVVVFTSLSSWLFSNTKAERYNIVLIVDLILTSIIVVFIISFIKLTHKLADYLNK